MRGASATVELVIIGILSVVLIGAAYVYSTNIAATRSEERVTTVDAVLCGNVLIIKNLGDVDADITRIYGVTGDGALEDTGAGGFRLRSRETRVLRLPKTYTAVAVAGYGIRTLIVANGCG